MRSIFIAAAAFFFAAQITDAACAAPPDRADFVSWAIARGAECDAQWQSATGPHGERARAESRRATEVQTAGRIAIQPARSKTRSSIDFCSSSGLMHTMASGVERLSLNTRERGTPTRGLPMLSSPAEAGLSQISARMRSLSSSLHWTKSFHTTKGAVRPALKSFGRLSQSARMGGASRPAFRAARPIKF